MKPTIKKIRDIMHTVAGFSITYPIAKATGLFRDNTWLSGFERFLIAIIALTLVSSFFGALYELIMNEITKERIPNDKDIIRTSVGGVLAAFATLLPYYGILPLALSILCVGFIVWDLFIREK